MKTGRLFSACFISAVLLLTACSTSPSAVRVVAVPEDGITPDAEMDEQGVLHVAYFADDNIYYVKSEDDGKTFTTPIQVNSETGTAQAGMFRGPDLTLGVNGRVHVVWYTNQFQRKRPIEEWGVRYAHFEPGADSFTPERNMNHLPSDNYSVAADGRGRVVITWTADAMYTQSSRDNGKTFSDPEQINIADPCECCATRTYFSSDGDLYIGYREKANNERDMHLLVQSDGDAFTRQPLSRTPWRIDACPMSGSSLVGNQDRLLAAWETKGAVYYGMMDAEGSALSNEVKVAETGRFPFALPTETGQVVAWKENEALVYRVFDTEGMPQGPDVRREGVGSHRPAGVVAQDGTVLLMP